MVPGPLKASIWELTPQHVDLQEHLGSDILEDKEESENPSKQIEPGFTPGAMKMTTFSYHVAMCYYCGSIALEPKHIYRKLYKWYLSHSKDLTSSIILNYKKEKRNGCVLSSCWGLLLFGPDFQVVLFSNPGCWDHMPK